MGVFRVLIVEDLEKDSRRLVMALRETLLSRLGDRGVESVELWTVTNQADADKAVLGTGPAGSRGFDLVLLDLRYPEVPGGQVNEDENIRFQGMKWLPALRRAQPRATIVLLTSHALSNDLETAVRAIRDFQADDVVPKNVSIHDLVARIVVACANNTRVNVMRRVQREFRSLVHSRFTRTYGEDLAQIVDQTKAKFFWIASRLESGDPAAVRTAPDDIRSGFNAFQDEFLRLTAYLTEGEDKREEVDIPEVLRDLAVLYQDRFREAGAQIVPPENGRPLKCITFASDLKIALHEVILNAADAFEQWQGGPRGERFCRLTAEQSAEGVDIHVVDNGPGFSDEAIERMCQLSIGGQQTRRGRGKGLYVARRMMHSIGGTLRVRNREQGGAEVVLSVRNLRPSPAPAELEPTGAMRQADLKDAGQP